MPRIDARLLPAVTDIERGLRELGTPFGIVGALVLGGIIDRLAGYDFTRTRVPHRLRHATGGLLDILPCDDGLAPSGKLQFDDGVTFNMAGFRYVVPHAVMTSVEDGPALPLARRSRRRQQRSRCRRVSVVGPFGDGIHERLIVELRRRGRDQE